MPLTAVHATAGVVDLTTDALRAPTAGTAAPDTTSPAAASADAVAWSTLHRARPRAPLTCRECGHGVHAKVSRTGMRFFAHDAGAPECSLAGESIAHRLLKLELASAIRAGGWHAELEVPGNGWRADVLATSPDGSTRMAWEAQLAAATIDELTERTAAMAADNVTVCWVTDKDRPFIGHVPSIRIATGAERDAAGDEQPEDADRTDAARDDDGRPRVLDGLGAFEPDWCEPRSRCQIWAQHGYYGRDKGPCGGHGSWRRPPNRLFLADFVRHVLAGSVQLIEARAEQPWALGRHRPGRLVWTTRPHWLAESEQVAATAVATAQAQQRQQKLDEHLTAIAALEARQKALTAPAVDLVGRETGGYVGVRDSSPEWAMGVPLFVHGIAQGVIAPVAGRVKGAVRDRLSALTVFVATSKERDRLAKVCAPGQRIVLFEVDVPDQAAPAAQPASAARPAVTAREAARLLTGFNLYR